MRLSQSVVLWQGRSVIQKISLFGKRPSPYHGKNSSNKQRETTVPHYFKTWRSVNTENVKNFGSFFKRSRKNHQALWWNWPSWGPPQERKTQSYLCLHGQIAAKKPLLKDTIKKRRLAWAKKHKQWTLDRWKSVLWSEESKFEIFVSNHLVFVRSRVGEWMISAC